jgi:hypothetical protein
MPKASTLMTHASAYNRVIETAIEQGWLNKYQNIPTLSRRGEKTKARPGFTVEEVNQLLEFMPKWVGLVGTGIRVAKSKKLCVTMWRYC